MIDHRVRAIRFWWLTLFAALSCIFAPEALGILIYGGFALNPVGLFMPVFPAEEEWCVCDFCQDSETYCEWQVVFSGWADNTCTGCNQLDGTYIVDTYLGVSGFTCEWEVSLGSSITIDCSPTDRIVQAIQVVVAETSATIYNVRAEFIQSGGAVAAGKRKQYGSKPPCNSFSGEVLNLDSSGFSNACNSAGVTATITGIPT